MGLFKEKENENIDFPLEEIKEDKKNIRRFSNNDLTPTNLDNKIKNLNPLSENFEINIKNIRQPNIMDSYSKSINEIGKYSLNEIIENENSKINFSLFKNDLNKQDSIPNIYFKEATIGTEKINQILIENQSFKCIYNKSAPNENIVPKSLKDRNRLFVQERQEGTNSFYGEATETENSVRTDIKNNQNRYSFTESNVTEQKSFYSRANRDRIFWSKEKMEDVRKRLNLARVRLMELERKDFAEIYDLINQNDIRVLDKLKTDHFKKFYSNELLTKNKIQEYLITEDRTEILVELIKDDFYTFDYNFCFKYLESLIKNYVYELDLANSNLKIVMKNVIEYNLFNRTMIDLIAWLAGYFQFYDIFREIVKNNEEFKEELVSHKNFNEDSIIWEYISQSTNIEQAVKLCLMEGFEKLATFIVKFANELKNRKTIEIAKERLYLNFLQFIWEATNQETVYSPSNNMNVLKELLKIRKNSDNLRDKRKSFFISNMGNCLFNNGLNIFILSDLIIYLIKLKKHIFINDILRKWKFLEKDQKLLTLLFENKCFDEITTLIWRRKISNWSFTKEQFKVVIKQEQTDLILYFLKMRECRVILEEFEIQETIVEKYMKYGSKMYYGAEMLLYIYKLNWNNDLTKNLCRNIMRTIKTKDILNCHSPVLTCLLISEFLKTNANVSVEHSSRCESVVGELMQFCLNIQEANPEESYIKFLMTQKDSKMRSSLQIASENAFYTVLKTPEIGTIVKKMWIGRITCNGYFKASSLDRYLDSNLKINDPFSSFDILDTYKNYFYQMSVWTNSCYWRYWPESASTIILIGIYNFFIYFLIERGQTMNTYSKLDYDLQLLLTFYIIWVICINLNIINLVVFGKKSKRKFFIDIWGSLEIVLLFSALALLIDFKDLMHDYTTDDINGVTDSLISELIFPISKSFPTIQISRFSGNYSHIIRVIVLALNDLLVWIRIVGILLTFKDIGPLIRMIYLMSVLLLKHLIIFGLFITCSAAIFTAVFYKKSSQFQDFSTTIITLFGGFVNNFDTQNFSSEISRTFGAISIIIFVCISGVLLINLLIAMLSNVYENLCVLVDASHRSVLISLYRKYKWDEENGYLIFLYTPFNILNLFVIPFSFCFKDKKRFNLVVCRIYYFLFYFQILFFILASYSFLIIPFCYLKGVVNVIKYQLKLRITKLLKIIKILKWIFLGLFFILWIYLRDIYFVLKTIFLKSNRRENVKNRIKNSLNSDDVVIFLKFIHSRNQEEPNDIHSLFLDYLLFEQQKKAENNDRLREKTDYISKLNIAARNVRDKQVSNKTSIVLRFNSDKNKNFPDSKISSNHIKKNLIIIEILENFVIQDGTKNESIDIDKLKMLLPKSLNIDNSYIKRLLYTHINSLNKAVNKLKSKKNLFLQYQLLNKIVQSAIRLDKEIDSEIIKSLRLQKSEVIKEINENEEFDKNEDLENCNETDRSIEVLTLIQNLIEEVQAHLKKFR